MLRRWDFKSWNAEGCHGREKTKSFWRVLVRKGFPPLAYKMSSHNVRYLSTRRPNNFKIGYLMSCLLILTIFRAPNFCLWSFFRVIHWPHCIIQNIVTWNMTSQNAVVSFWRSISKIVHFSEVPAKIFQRAPFFSVYTRLQSSLMTSQDASYGKDKKLIISQFPLHIFPFSQNV